MRNDNRRANTHLAGSAPAFPEVDLRFVDIAGLRKIFPVTDMTIWRWMRDPKVAFPLPQKLGRNGKNYWWLPAIRAWQAQRPVRSVDDLRG
jgi:predicted DNA-binding transcriptional regulator AlpA